MRWPLELADRRILFFFEMTFLIILLLTIQIIRVNFKIRELVIIQVDCCVLFVETS